MKQIFTIALLISFFFSSAQIDQERMDRDLEIAENILATLMDIDNNSWRYSSNKIEGNYLPDFGVIFGVPLNALPLQEFEEILIFDENELEEEIIIADPKMQKKIKEKIEEKMKKEIEKGMKMKEEVIHQQGNIDEDKLREKLEVFFLDYADLIGQIKSSEKIMINIKANKPYRYLYGKSQKVNGGFTAEMSKSDIRSYKQGKISREKAAERMTLVSKSTSSTTRDIELFASIFARLFEPDLSSTYYMTKGGLSYEELDGFGAIFNMKVYSSSENNGKHTIRTTGQSGLSREERERVVNAMYPDFKKYLLEGILDYGRTVRSLDSKEVMVFKVRLTECKNCEMPEEIEVTIAGNVLAQYDQGALSKEKALTKFTVEEKG